MTTYTTKTAKNGSVRYYDAKTGKVIAKKTALENERNFIVANGTAKERYELAKETFRVSDNRVEKLGYHRVIVGSQKNGWQYDSKYEWHRVDESIANIELKREFNLTLDEFRAQAQEVVAEVEEPATAEVEDYAVSTEAQEVATEAEIEQANQTESTTAIVPVEFYAVQTAYLQTIMQDARLAALKELQAEELRKARAEQAKIAAAERQAAQDAAIRSGNYTAQINKATVRFENNQIVQIDEGYYHFEVRYSFKSGKIIKRFYYNDTSTGRLAKKTVSAKRIIEDYMNSQIAEEQGKIFKDFLDAYKQNSKGFFEAWVTVTFADNRAHNATANFDNFNHAKAFVDEAKKIFAGMKMDAVIKHDFARYYTLTEDGTETFDLPDTSFFNGYSKDEIQSRINQINNAIADNEQAQENADSYVWSALCAANSRLKQTRLFYEFILRQAQLAQQPLTDNQLKAQEIIRKLDGLLVKFEHAGIGKNGGLALHYATFKNDNDEFGAPVWLVEVFTDEHSYILDHVNLIRGYDADKTVETFHFNHDSLSVNQQLAAVIVSKLGGLNVEPLFRFNFFKDGRRIKVYKTLRTPADKFGTNLFIYEVFTDKNSFILDYVNLVTVNPDDSDSVETFHFFKPDVKPPAPQTFVATQITFPNGLEGEPTRELSQAFVNLDDAAKFIADDYPIIDLKPAYPGAYFGGIFFAGWRIEHNGKILCSCDWLGNTHGDEATVSLVNKFIDENDEFILPALPGFLAPEAQDDCEEFSPKVEIVKGLFNFDEALGAKKILKPIADKAHVELGTLKLGNHDNERKSCEVLAQVSGSTNAIDKFKTLLRDRYPAKQHAFEEGKVYTLQARNALNQPLARKFKILKRGKVFVRTSR